MVEIQWLGQDFLWVWEKEKQKRGRCVIIGFVKRRGKGSGSFVLLKQAKKASVGKAEGRATRFLFDEKAKKKTKGNKEKMRAFAFSVACFSRHSASCRGRCGGPCFFFLFFCLLSPLLFVIKSRVYTFSRKHAPYFALLFSFLFLLLFPAPSWALPLKSNAQNNQERKNTHFLFSKVKLCFADPFHFCSFPSYSCFFYCVSVQGNPNRNTSLWRFHRADC